MPIQSRPPKNNMTGKKEKEKRPTPDYRKPVIQTTKAIHKNHIRAGLMALMQDWPQGEGLENLLDLLTAPISIIW